MMAPAISISLVVLTLLSSGCSHLRPVGPLASIRLERPENNGSVNILPCWITFSSGQSVKLSGGEAASLSMPAGYLWVEVSSADPYRTECSELRAWRSRRLHLHLTAGDVVRLSVEPKSRGSTYTGGWGIERAANEVTAPDSADAAPLGMLNLSAADPVTFMR